jgi:hypothetical protein
MYYIGITIRGEEAFSCSDIKHENGILYVRKGLKPEDLLVPAHELESFKGKVRRLDINLYNRLNDNFGLHQMDESKEKPVSVIRLKLKPKLKAKLKLNLKPVV